MSKANREGMEDIEYDGSLVWQKTSDYALGARGIDAISVTTATGTTISYPIYDAHGNMISTLSKAGSGYTFTAERSFDAWGVIRLGAQSGDPKGRYCASLGHKQDDESGLVYMRARYYEPGSGRFISEDPARQDQTPFSYAHNCPTAFSDRDGKAALPWILLFVAVTGFCDWCWKPKDPISQAIKTVIAATLSAFSAVRGACAFLSADEGKLGAGNVIGAGAFILIAGALAEIAIQQLLCAFVFMADPENSWSQQSAGNPLYQFGVL